LYNTLQVIGRDYSGVSTISTKNWLAPLTLERKRDTIEISLLRPQSQPVHGDIGASFTEPSSFRR